MIFSMEKKEIVVIGGGTGTHTVLKGLKQHKRHVSLSAIVTMADSGGSTGRLRDEFGYLPVGDVRMALTALSRDVNDHEELMRELFLYRFDKGEGLSGHNFGNLLLVALTDILGSEEAAIRAASRVLRVQGTVIPVTTDKVHLVATYEDGTVVEGEHEIDEPNSRYAEQRIINLKVTPTVPVNPRAAEAILQADMIVLGPGDLYTSVLANCVVDGISDAICRSTGKLVYISNLMTKVGQTNGMGVKEHISEITKYVKRAPEYVLVNRSEFPPDLLARYQEDNEFPVRQNYDDSCGIVIVDDLVAKEELKTAGGDVLKRSLIRHDSDKLAQKLMDILENQ